MSMRVFIKKYKTLSLPLRSALWFTVCQFLQKGVSMITTPIFTRILSTEEYGRVNTFSSWTELTTILICLSVWRGLLNLYKEYEERDKALTSIFSLSMIISMIWLAVLVLGYPFFINVLQLSKELYSSLILYGISQNIIVAWTVRKQYDYDYKPIIIITLTNTIFSSVGGALAVLLIDQTAECRIAPQIICYTLTALGILLISFKKYGLQINKKIWHFCMKFAIPLIPHYLSEVVLNSSDKIMINSMCGPSEVALYSIAYSVGSLILLITSAINSAFAPYQYQEIKKEEYKKLAKNTNIIILFIAICCSFIIMFSSEIVLIFGGEKYIDCISIIIPIAIGVYFNYVFQIFARVQEYFEQKSTIVIASVACAIMNLLLNYIFIPIYGYGAAAYTTLFCYFAFCFLHYVFYRKACKKNIGVEIYDIKGLAIISAMLGISSFVIYYINQILVLKYIVLFVVLVFMLIFRKKIIEFAKNIKKG